MTRRRVFKLTCFFHEEMRMVIHAGVKITARAIHDNVKEDKLATANPLHAYSCVGDFCDPGTLDGTHYREIN